MPGNKIRDQTEAEVQDTALRTGMSLGWEAAVKAKAMARAPSPLGRRDALAMPPPYKAIPPSAKRSPPVPQAAAKPQGKPPPPSPDTLVTSPPGVQDVGARGPDFGGSYTPESTAGVVFHTLQSPSGNDGQVRPDVGRGSLGQGLKNVPKDGF